MKVRMKFDKQAIVGFFAQNGEKVVFGVVVLCFLGFVYSGIRRDRFDKTPQDFRAAADRLTQGIQSSEGKKEPPIKNPVVDIDNRVSVGPYQLPQAWNPPVPDPLNPRGEPALFTVEDLRVSAGVGRFGNQAGGMGAPMMGGAAGGAGNARQEPLGRRWVLVTGLVNAEKLVKSYQDCFRDAAKRLPTDVPTVTYFEVRRAEVGVGDEDVEKLKWVRPYQNLAQYIAKYRALGAGSDVVAQQFMEPWLTFVLPQRMDRAWGDEVAHPPEVPLASLSPQGLPVTPGEDPTRPADKPGDEPGPEDADAPRPDEPVAGGPGAGAPGMGMGAPGMGMPGMGMGSPGMGMPGMEMPGMGMGGPGMGMPGMGMPGMGMPGMGMPGGVAGQTNSPYKLFRFFDFNVKPGKRYRYQVRIYFANPNDKDKVLDQFLSSELRERRREGKEKPYIMSPWSDASDVVLVPRDDRLLAVSVSSAGQVDIEPSATIRAIHWDEQMGTEVSSEFSVKPGMVADFPDQDPPQPAGGQMPGMGPGPAPGPPPLPAGRAGRRGGGQGAPVIPGFPTPPAPEKIDYMTKMLVLDIQGGQRLPGKNRDLAWPGEILLMDPDGVLQVRSDVDDQAEIEKQKSGAAGATGMPGMGAPGMGMPGMGMPGMGMPGMGMPGMGMPGGGPAFPGAGE